MYPMSVSVGPAAEPRARGSIAVRLFLLIPHMVVLYFLQIAANLATFVQWFVALFTGRRNAAIHDFVGRYLAYTTSVSGYGLLLHDRFPGFVTVAADDPVQVQLPPVDGPVNRLAVGLRFLFMIPAAIIAGVVMLAAQVVCIICWFSLLFSGTTPGGMRDLLEKALRYNAQVQAYGLLMTDEYPWPSATGLTA